MMITLCTLKQKAISLILVLAPAACVTRAGFILSVSKNHNAQQIQTLANTDSRVTGVDSPLLGNSYSCVYLERKCKMIYQL